MQVLYMQCPPNLGIEDLDIEVRKVWIRILLRRRKKEHITLAWCYWEHFTRIGLGDVS